MGKILVPIDFSENSIIAARYAREIALENQDELVFLHVYTRHVNKYANFMVHGEHIVDPTIKESEEQLNQLVGVVKEKWPTLVISQLFDEGILAEVISKETARNQYKVVVMGTKGASGLESVLIGSNTYDVIRDSQTPILAIPANATAYKKDTIALLTNFKPGELEVLKQAIPVFGSKFHLLLIHINKEEVDIKILDKKLTEWIDNIITETGIDDISYTVKNRSHFANSAEKIANGIQTMIRDENIDIILITKSRKTFFQNLFNENIIKEMAMGIVIPNFFGKTNPNSTIPK
ncbi:MULTISPECIES: universal stress protein [Sphingobacterium]|uniref:universal stress protein n=1 Tax=Sphingobacterium TaxID=28453 RepID=UPI0010528194|nr:MULTISPECIES: universal stress protein [Sphingobacterium]MCW2260960.1 nucleotide-binding universal stress UspA family protein [Sphingobacterium kitahiroshimense]NJI76390.1 universal stress protein [Sphingobacterium sp. B16(2022)]TCR08404.1 nucleotide-binding universal stress UspA family protein [Sphingobacterium sp. JUb78]